MNSTFIIIVHYGRISDTFECLKSIYSDKTAPPALLIDNSLNPALTDTIRIFKKVKLLSPVKNLGFAGANNFGIKKALDLGAGYVILLNNDTLVPNDFFRKIIEFASKTHDAGLISPKIYFANGYEYQKGKYRDEDLGKVIWYAGGIIDWENIYASHRGVDEVDRGQYEQIVETDFATGCAVLIKKEVIDKIGFMDENYFLYYEDADYSQCAKKKNWSVIYYPHAFVWHKNALSSQGSGSPLHQYYQTRNRLYFGFKFAKFRTKFSLIKESISHFGFGEIKRKAVLDFYLHRMGKAEI